MKVLQTILLIEDDLAIIEVIRMVLASTISTIERILVAHTLAEGLDFLLDNGIDLVILDPNLPDSTGLNSLRQIQHTYPKTQMVIFTASSDSRIAIAAERLGVRYLSKSAFVAGHLTMLPLELRLAMMAHDEPILHTVSEEADFDIEDIKDFYRWRGEVDTKLANVDTKLGSVVVTHAETCKNLVSARESMDAKFAGVQATIDMKFEKQDTKNSKEIKDVTDSIKKLQIIVATCNGVLIALGFVTKVLKLW